MTPELQTEMSLALSAAGQLYKSLYIHVYPVGVDAVSLGIPP